MTSMDARLDVSIHLGLPGFTLDVEWTAGDGVAVLFGPSGAGKTLTLQCLAGLARPERGRIVVDGRVFFDRSTAPTLEFKMQQQRGRRPAPRAASGGGE